MTHMIVIICNTQHFVSTNSIFSWIQISLPNFAFFNVKSPSVTQRWVSQKNAFEKSKTLLPFLLKTIGSNNYFTVIENNFRFLR